MDTDVEILKPLDKFLVHKAFSGFENVCSIPTGIMGSEKGFEGFRNLLALFDGRRFTLEDGRLDMTSNVKTITEYYSQRGLVRNNSFQVVEGFTLYPNIVFCPYKHEIGSRYFNETVTIHHKYGSWIPSEEYKSFKGGRSRGMKELVKRMLLTILGKRIFDKLLIGLYMKAEKRNRVEI